MDREQFATMYSHPHRPRPGRRRHHLALYNISVLSIVLIVITFTTPVRARNIQLSYKEYDSPQFRRLERRGAIMIDRRDPPPRPHIRQRQEGGDLFGSTAVPLPAPSSEPSTTDAASSTKTDSTTTIQTAQVVTPTLTVTESSSAAATENASTSIETASSTVEAAPSPSAFDTSLGSNFTSGACPRFFDNFLNNATFVECHPTSLLLQNSNSFFRTSRSPVLLSQALDASCRASPDRCSPVMSSLASQLVQDSNCGQDYRNENPLVTQAYAGLIAYEPLYRATCLKNDATGQYCFADAITNTSNPADPYPYYTALGTNLPGSSRPTCDKCLQDTMAIFAGFAANKAQPLSKTYTSTAEQINLGCGPEFVNATVPVGTVENGAARHGAVTDTSALMAFVVGLVVAIMAV